MIVQKWKNMENYASAQLLLFINNNIFVVYLIFLQTPFTFHISFKFERRRTKTKFTQAKNADGKYLFIWRISFLGCFNNISMVKRKHMCTTIEKVTTRTGAHFPPNQWV